MNSKEEDLNEDPIGSFCCVFCHKTFKYEMKILGISRDEVEVTHINVHRARFLKAFFSAEDVNSAFFEFCLSEFTMKNLRKI